MFGNNNVNFGKGMGKRRGMGLGRGFGLERMMGFCRYGNYNYSLQLPNEEKEILKNRLKEEIVVLEERKREIKKILNELR